MTTLTRRTALLAVLTAALLPLLPSQAKPAPKPQPAKVVLPSWAPKKPSKEFLRAAKVLKPIPEEVQPYDPLYVPAWELFGSLTDAQMATFAKVQQHVVSTPSTDEERQRLKERMDVREEGGKFVYYTHEVLVLYPALTPAQRRAFDRVAKAWPHPQKGRTDLLVQLYKLGAKKDLSNLEVGFTAIGAHGVKLEFRVETRSEVEAPEGHVRVMMGTAGFGELVAYL
jgi:hypothetical protein